MAFRDEEHKTSFLQKIKNAREQHRANVQRKLDQRTAKESAELKRLQDDLKRRQLTEKVRLAKQKQVLTQRRQLANIKAEERKTKAELRKFTTTGRAISFIKKEADVIKKATKGRPRRKVASRKATTRAVKKYKDSLPSAFGGGKGFKRKSVKRTTTKRKTVKKRRKPRREVFGI